MLVVEVDLAQSLASLDWKAFLDYLDLQVTLVIQADLDLMLLMARKVCTVKVHGYELNCVYNSCQ